MARPSPRLDLLLVPRDEAAPAQRALDLLALLEREDVIEASGRPSSGAHAWSPDGFSRIVLDRPEQVALYGSGQGGFLVRCPQSGQIVTAAFSSALTKARSGAGPWSMACPGCAERHAFLSREGCALDFAPRAAFGRFALVTVDIGGPELSTWAMERAKALLGPVSVVLRRG